MSAFDDWLEQYKLKSDWRTLTEEEDVENAFNAGLEAAAQECESVDEKTCANLIRALKE